MTDVLFTPLAPAPFAPEDDAELFRALADPTRLILVGRLATAEKPLTVTELSSCCGVHLSGVSRHLRTLREAGVIRAQKEGREVYYSLEVDTLITTLRGHADALANCCEAADCCNATGCLPTPTPDKGNPS